MGKFLRLHHVLLFFVLIYTLITLVAFVFPPRVASETTYYFNGAVNGDWNNLGNWWSDAGFTTPAGSLPTVSDNVIASASITINGGPAASVNAFTLNGGYNNLNISITVSNQAVFNDQTQNNGGIIGDAVFNESSTNGLEVTGNAEFNDSSTNGGTVFGNATFNDNASSYQIIEGNATFNGNSVNEGTITGNVTFNDSSSHIAGTITGDALFIGDVSDIPYGSIVSGTKTRRYTESATITRNFLTNGPWIVEVDGAGVVVDVSGATYDGTTTFSEINTGSFQYTAPVVESDTAPVNRSGGHRRSSTVNTNMVPGVATSVPAVVFSTSSSPTPYPSSTPLIQEVSVFTFSKPLSIGMYDTDIKRLQKFFNGIGFFVAQSGPGSYGNETNYFGQSTLATLIKFQKVYGIKPAVGYFGPVTMSFVNNILKK